jgi:hypothetical protein
MVTLHRHGREGGSVASVDGWRGAGVISAAARIEQRGQTARVARTTIVDRRKSPIVLLVRIGRGGDDHVSARVGVEAGRGGVFAGGDGVKGVRGVTV